MKCAPLFRSRRAGFTLVELAVGATILTIVVCTIGLVAVRGMNAFSSGQDAVEMEMKNSMSANQITEAFLGLRVDGVNPLPQAPFSTSWIEYRTPEAVNGSNFDWSGTTRVEFAYFPDEVDDGVDNNGNGLIDEGVVQVTTNLGEDDEQTRVVKRWVAELAEGELPNGLDDNGDGLIDEGGLCFYYKGGSLVMQITVSMPGEAGKITTKTVESTVRLRN